MILIIGGAYQGKKEFVKKEFHLDEKDIYEINNDSIIDISNKANIKCFNHFERIINSIYKDNKEIKDIKDELINIVNDKIIIFEDIFSGVVPMNKVLRIKREMAGMLVNFLANDSNEIYEIKLGISRRLK